MYNGIGFTSSTDIERITSSAFRILNDYGALVEHQGLAKLMCDHAPDKITFNGGRVRIKSDFVQDYFGSFANTSPKALRQPSASAVAEIYEGPYHDPYDGEFKVWNEERLLSYVKLAQRLPDVGKASMLGCPLPDLPLNKKPLYEKLYAFKYGISGSSSIWDTELCPSLYNIWEIYAEEQQQPIEAVFQGGVFMISPLKMGYVESEQMLWFRERGIWFDFIYAFCLFVFSVCELFAKHFSWKHFSAKLQFLTYLPPTSQA